MKNDMISAIATAEGRGGVAIVRMSGDNVLDLAKKMVSRKGDFEPNRMYPCTIDGGSFTDFGLCVYFRAPKSYTGEDTVEFHLHGGREIARGILRQTFALGARPAERGEFTKRAFLNGKLSLSAAEGVADMIDAESEAQVRAGYSLYMEKLTGEANRLQALLTTCLARVDVDLDYPEEDLSGDSREQTLNDLQTVKSVLEGLLNQYKTGRKIKNGVSVALCGSPNAGKSSLFNALLGYDRAIVSSVAGTTRDTVEGAIEINGVLFRLTDTAGLRESEDEIEREGIRRAERSIRSADVIVYLKGDEPTDFPSSTPVITVGAKCDIERKDGCDLLISSLTGEGIEELKELLYEKGYGRENGAFLLEERHYNAVKEAHAATLEALESAKTALPELYAEDISRAWSALGKLSGETVSEQVVAEIFDKFCVGK